MITPEQNAYLTQSGPGTPMGELFRRYWIPAMLAAELPQPDCPPLRVRLLSERLIGFRDSSGRLGLMDEFCAHRGVSLWFGRNEEDGLRCPYHGWKYDVTGQCVEVPSEPEASGFCRRIKLRSYPCIERADVIWTYMGPAPAPPAPAFEWVSLPRSQVYVSKRLQECNYLQAMEGGIDPSHVSFLHSFDLDRDPLHRNTSGAKFTRSTRTIFDILESPGGLLIGARRNADPGHHYWRVTQWLMPWYTLIPPYGRHALNGHAFVPIDDHNCMVWTMTFHPARELEAEERDLMKDGAGVHAALIPGTFRPVANRANDYLMDRASQAANLTFSGIRGIPIQDASVQESMGPVQDRTREQPVSTDNAIIMARRRLREAAAAVVDGARAPGLDAVAQNVRSASFLLPEHASFRDAVPAAIKVRKGEPHIAV